MEKARRPCWSLLRQPNPDKRWMHFCMVYWLIPSTLRQRQSKESRVLWQSASLTRRISSWPGETSPQNRPDTLTQTFFIHQLFPCSQTADHTFQQVHRAEPRWPGELARKRTQYKRTPLGLGCERLLSHRQKGAL